MPTPSVALAAAVLALALAGLAAPMESPLFGSRGIGLADVMAFLDEGGQQAPAVPTRGPVMPRTTSAACAPVPAGPVSSPSSPSSTAPRREDESAPESKFESSVANDDELSPDGDRNESEVVVTGEDVMLPVDFAHAMGVQQGAVETGDLPDNKGKHDTDSESPEPTGDAELRPDSDTDPAASYSIASDDGVSVADSVDKPAMGAEPESDDVVHGADRNPDLDNDSDADIDLRADPDQGSLQEEDTDRNGGGETDPNENPSAEAHDPIRGDQSRTDRNAAGTQQTMNPHEPEPGPETDCDPGRTPDPNSASSQPDPNTDSARDPIADSDVADLRPAAAPACDDIARYDPQPDPVAVNDIASSSACVAGQHDAEPADWTATSAPDAEEAAHPEGQQHGAGLADRAAASPPEANDAVRWEGQHGDGPADPGPSTARPSGTDQAAHREPPCNPDSASTTAPSSRSDAVSISVGVVLSATLASLAAVVFVQLRKRRLARGQAAAWSRPASQAALLPETAV